MFCIIFLLKLYVIFIIFSVLIDSMFLGLQSVQHTKRVNDVFSVMFRQFSVPKCLFKKLSSKKRDTEAGFVNDFKNRQFGGIRDRNYTLIL